MRLSPEALEKITGLRRPAFQARWFKTHYGVTLPRDRHGVIITKDSWEGLCAKKCGLIHAAPIRPEVHLVKKAA